MLKSFGDVGTGKMYFEHGKDMDLEEQKADVYGLNCIPPIEIIC